MEFSNSISFGRSPNPAPAPFVMPASSDQPPQPPTERRTTFPRFAPQANIREASKPLLTAKRLIDISGASFGLIVLAPFLIGVAVAIKATSPGPVFFRQKRYGYHNRRFWIYKFRTMFIHLSDNRGTCQALADDPRATPLGRILRKTSFDELPQLVNVLKGDMSLVGPRPHVPGMLAGGLLYEELTPYYFQRHNMRPGVTGLAQVCGYRGSTMDPVSAINRLDLDLRYIQMWSFWLDVTIIVRTAINEFLLGPAIRARRSNRTIATIAAQLGKLNLRWWLHPPKNDDSAADPA
jgi:lipopolysaccharide/colanic/teichoic acid biosynthesis glycosyltransferase